MRLHNGEKPFACKLCNAKFTQFVHLKLHRRLHANDRPFEVLSLCEVLLPPRVAELLLHNIGF